jgi:hypothetical protein
MSGREFVGGIPGVEESFVLRRGVTWGESGKIDGGMERFAFHCLVREFLLCFHHGFRMQLTVCF